MKTASPAGVVFAVDAGAVIMTSVGEDQAGADLRNKLEKLKLPRVRTDLPDPFTLS